MNLLRCLIMNKQVSLTLADTTKIVAEGIRLHDLSPASAYTYGRGMSALTYMSSCLKEESGELSIAFQCDGEAGDFSASGNRALCLRGYIGNTQIGGEPNSETETRALGRGALTVIRDDGYSRPFVGSCAFPDTPDMDGIIEEYYRISEQLPTRIKTMVIFDGKELVFAGVAALQPLPFALEETLRSVWELDLEELLLSVKEKGIEELAATFEEEKLLHAEYRCNCSREYLTRVLVTLGEEQLRDIIRTEGAVRVHCHYCNRDYEFTSQDADLLFPKKV